MNETLLEASLKRLTEQTPEFCLLGIQHWSTCMTKAEWGTWAQCGLTAFAAGIAIWAVREPIRHAARARRAARLNELAAAATNLVLIAEQGAAIAHRLRAIGEGGLRQTESFASEGRGPMSTELQALLSQVDESVERHRGNRMIATTQTDLYHLIRHLLERVDGTGRLLPEEAAAMLRSPDLVATLSQLGTCGRNMHELSTALGKAADALEGQF
jgi:hypothetical protein